MGVHSSTLGLRDHGDGDCAVDTHNANSTREGVVCVRVTTFDLCQRYVTGVTVPRPHMG